MRTMKRNKMAGATQVLLLALGLASTDIARACDYEDQRAKGAESSGGALMSKSQYSLFCKTPDDRMRGFATDRPDKTESAYTLDAGHIMHETDLVNYTYNQDNGVRSDSYFLFAPNLKVGLTNSSDLQFIYQPYVNQREKVTATRASTRRDGSGDLVVRLKTNMWGNDEGDTAGAVMPYVKVPLGKKELGNDSVEGGIIFPFAVSLSDDTGVGFMTQVDFLRNDADTDYYAQFVNTATISTALIGELSGYSEVFVAKSSQTDAEVTFDTGLTYMVTPNMQLDMGVNIGVTGAADDLNPFVGLSQRF